MTEPQGNHGKSDTSPEARRVLYDLCRRMPLGRKLELIFDMQDMGKQLAMAGLRMRHPEASEEEIWYLWARQHLGDQLYEEVYGKRDGFRPSKGGGGGVGLCMSLKDRYESLQKILRDLGQVVVAYSGGVDSTFLLKAAVDTLGAENVLACTSIGVAEPSHLYERARQAAESIGVELMTVEAGEMEDPCFTANNADRCFHCKSRLCHRLLDVAQERGIEHVVFGTNRDDLDDFRPGNRAIKTFGIRSPLAEAGLTKDDIRQLSRQVGLPTADQPASPCLASRIAYGLEITEQRLEQVDQAESFLRSLGFIEFRVRHHDMLARIEVRPQDVPKLTVEPVRSQVVEKLKSLGFQFVTIDLQGFRSGSLNEALSQEQKKAGMGA